MTPKASVLSDKRRQVKLFTEGEDQTLLKQATDLEKFKRMTVLDRLLAISYSR